MTSAYHRLRYSSIGAAWAARVTLAELVGVPARKLNDDRRGRALDATLHEPHLAEIWSEIVSRALVRYQIDLREAWCSRRDTTAFYFEGEYANSPHIQLGRFACRSHRSKKQRKLALNPSASSGPATSREKLPFLYELLDGGVADPHLRWGRCVATVQANTPALAAQVQV
ncbi:MAG: hypothetical protein HY784_06725 [Chloroflexi bacterium]|nr:hypothetical protein [Chloroflexota bacterium]